MLPYAERSCQRTPPNHTQTPQWANRNDRASRGGFLFEGTELLTVFHVGEGDTIRETLIQVCKCLISPQIGDHRREDQNTVVSVAQLNSDETFRIMSVFRSTRHRKNSVIDACDLASRFEASSMKLQLHRGSIRNAFQRMSSARTPISERKAASKISKQLIR